MWCEAFLAVQGTMAGILFGLSHLNNSEVSLKALYYKKGYVCMYVCMCVCDVCTQSVMYVCAGCWGGTS